MTKRVLVVDDDGWASYEPTEPTEWLLKPKRRRRRKDPYDHPVPFAEEDTAWPGARVWRRTSYLGDVLEGIRDCRPCLDFALKLADENDALFEVYLAGLMPEERERVLARIAGDPGWQELYRLRQANAERARAHKERRVANDH